MSSTIPKRTTGDDWDIPVDIKDEDGQPLDGAGGSVEAVLTTSDDSSAEAVGAAKAMSDAQPGANWSGGRYVLHWTSIETAAITAYGQLWIEVQVTTASGRKITPCRHRITVKKGVIA